MSPVEPLPIEALDQLAQALADGRPPPPSAAQAFIFVWRRYRWCGIPFEQAAGRSGPLALRLRNQAILAAAALLDDGRKGRWQLAGELQTAARRYESASRPTNRLAEFIARARLANGGPLPGSQRFYNDLLKAAENR
jgi:hypothetical protein